ncbi:hypothetical protein N0675_18830, partial [Pseudomonas aeruginosa]|nr:hypothetical protein [Pseudomonas aeruginosa]MCT0883942.1 hypothetical protein [Pseudomonas aeruginosa]MCT0889784.1 hypothetical protein [Pseudomonas aeruginosa]MCT0914570.1 hypothetical protein [Pseudomonas aeruginosa]
MAKLHKDDQAQPCSSPDGRPSNNLPIPLLGPFDLLPDFSTTPNLVESVFRAGDGSEKAFYRRADSRLP